MKRINTELFLRWLNQQVETCTRLEKECVKKGNYINALKYHEEAGTYDFLIETIESDSPLDDQDWLEVVEDES